MKWRQTKKRTGKVNGIASANALVNLVESGVLTKEWVDDYLIKSKTENSNNMNKNETTLHQ